MTRTRVPGSTDNRLASALPAEPPPTMMKSYLGGAMARDASSVEARNVERRRVGRGPAAVSLPGSGPLAPRPGSSPAAEELAAGGEPGAAVAGEEDHRVQAGAWQRQPLVDMCVTVGDRQGHAVRCDDVGRSRAAVARHDALACGHRVGALRRQDEALDVDQETAVREELRVALVDR